MPIGQIICGGLSQNRNGPTGDLMRSISTVLASLFLSGCGTSPIAPLPDVPNAIAWKEINQNIYSTFNSLKISGAPEISPLHRNDALGPLAEWAICLRNHGGNNVKYVVFLISQNKIVDFRLAIDLDRCEEQDYMPLPQPIQKPAPPVKQNPIRHN
jgi:hypothetical protein